jgi:hypothetical protein
MLQRSQNFWRFSLAFLVYRRDRLLLVMNSGQRLAIKGVLVPP